MNNTALITGSSKRVGRAVAEYLASKGWNIFIHYNSSVKYARELENILEERYPEQKFSTIKANLSDESEVEQLIPRVISETDSLDLLINNASVFDKSYISETGVALFNSQFNINLRAPFLLMRDFSKYAGKGNIINFADTRITHNNSDYAAYSLSKKALWELTKMAALEFSPGIRVNAIAPGLTLPPEGKDYEYLLKLAEKIPMKRPGGIDQIIKSVEFILENDHLTGQLLFADGGENISRNS
ncbi:MAG: SDR family oxidoreductase [Prolixibacteraceae bacterium]|nr:SDR family oxidoreductase [Prolixibacteraceae bacterium]